MPWRACWKISWEVGLTALEIQQEGGSEPKNISCILGFQATQSLTRAHPPLCVGKSQSISETNNSGLQT